MSTRNALQESSSREQKYVWLIYLPDRLRETIKFLHLSMFRGNSLDPHSDRMHKLRLKVELITNSFVRNKLYELNNAHGADVACIEIEFNS